MAAIDSIADANNTADASQILNVLNVDDKLKAIRERQLSFLGTNDIALIGA